MIRSTFKTRRARIAAVLGVLGVLAITGTALAYYLAQGTGTASVSGGSAPVATLTAGSVPSGALYPGGATITVPVSIGMTGGGSVGAVHVASIDTPAGCSAGWFSFGDSAPVGTLPAGANPDAAAVTVTMAESGSDQSACELANMTLHLVTVP